MIEYDQDEGVEELVVPSKSPLPVSTPPTPVITFNNQLVDATPTPAVLPAEALAHVDPEGEAEEEDESAWDSDVSFGFSFGMPIRSMFTSLVYDSSDASPNEYHNRLFDFEK